MHSTPLEVGNQTVPGNSGDPGQNGDDPEGTTPENKFPNLASVAGCGPPQVLPVLKMEDIGLQAVPHVTSLLHAAATSGDQETIKFLVQVCIGPVHLFLLSSCLFCRSLFGFRLML